jgi:hypothetical protein
MLLIICYLHYHGSVFQHPSRYNNLFVRYLRLYNLQAWMLIYLPKAATVGSVQLRAAARQTTRRGGAIVPHRLFCL